MQTEGSGGLKMSLPARADNVSVVRHAVAGLAEALGMEEDGVADLKTVVTEAAMNVVVHAYDGADGLLEIDAVPEPEELRVAVRDFGHGIRPSAGEGSDSLRLGLSLIAALSQRFQISGGVGGGTEITTWHALHQSPPIEAADPGGDTAPEMHLTVGEAELLRPVLSRAISALAARQDLTIERLSDATLLVDAISAGAAGGFGDRPLSVSLLDGDGTIDLRIGPMDLGSAQRMREGLRLKSLEGSLETLADEMRSESDDSGDFLVARFASLRADVDENAL